MTRPRLSHSIPTGPRNAIAQVHTWALRFYVQGGWLSLLLLITSPALSQEKAPAGLDFQWSLFRPVDYNRVDGLLFGPRFRVGPRITQALPSLEFTLFLPTEKNTRSYFSFEAQLQSTLFPATPLTIGVRGYKKTDSNDRWFLTNLLNSAIAFLSKNDYRNYFEREGFTLFAHLEPLPGFALGLEYANDRYRNLLARDPFTLTGGDRPFRLNPPIDEGTIRSLTFRAGLDTRPPLWLFYSGWQASVEVEEAGRLLGSDFLFTRLRLDLARYNRIFGEQSLDIRLIWATATTSLPLQRTYILGSLGGLHGFSYLELAGDRLLLLNLAYRRPISFLELLVFFDAGTAFFSDPSRNNPRNPIFHTRAQPSLSLPPPSDFDDLRTAIGTGVGIDLFNTLIGVIGAQNLNDFRVGPRFFLLARRSF